VISVLGAFGWWKSSQLQLAKTANDTLNDEKLRIAHNLAQEQVDARERTEEMRMNALPAAITADLTQLALGEQDELRALLARQAYCFYQRAKTPHSFAPVDAALRQVLGNPFSVQLNTPDIVAADVSPDGNTLATATRDGQISLWPLGRPSSPTHFTDPHHDANGNGDRRFLRFTVDGLGLLSFSSDIQLFNIDGTVRTTFVRPAGGFTAVGMFGKTLAIANAEGHIDIWKTTAFTSPPMLTLHGAHNITALAFDRTNEKVIAGTTTGSVICWHLPTSAPVATIEAVHTAAVNSVTFDATSARFASASSDRTAKIFDLAISHTTPVHTLPHPDIVEGISFSSGAPGFITSDGLGVIRFWSANETDSPALQLKGHRWHASILAYSSDGRHLLSTGSMGDTRLWYLGSPIAVPLVVKAHNGSIESLDFSPDSRFLASDDITSDSGVTLDTMGKVWQVDSFSAAQRPTELRHSAGIWAIAYSPNGDAVATACEDKTVRLWHLDSAAHPFRSLEHESSVTTVAFVSESRIVSGCGDGTVWYWECDGPAAMRFPVGRHSTSNNRASVCWLSVAPDATTVASGCEDGRIFLWNLAKRDGQPRVLDAHDKAVHALAFSPDGNLLASGESYMKKMRYTGNEKHKDRNAKVLLWSLIRLAEEPIMLAGHGGAVTSVTFPKDKGSGLLASASDDGTVRLWNTNKLDSLPAVLDAHRYPVRSVAFSSDGNWLASGGRDGKLILWKTSEFLSDYVERVMVRNLTYDEWREFVGQDVPYEKTCSRLPIHASVIEMGASLAKDGNTEAVGNMFHVSIRTEGEETVAAKLLAELHEIVDGRAKESYETMPSRDELFKECDPIRLQKLLDVATHLRGAQNTIAKEDASAIAATALLTRAKWLAQHISSEGIGSSQYKDAQQLLQRAIATDPSRAAMFASDFRSASVSALLQAGDWEAERRRDFSAAKRLYEMAVALDKSIDVDPDQRADKVVSDAWSREARAVLVRVNDETPYEQLRWVLRDYMRLVREKPGSVDGKCWSVLVTAVERGVEGKLAEAVTMVEQAVVLNSALQLDPQRFAAGCDAIGRAESARALARMGKITEAVDVYQRLTADHARFGISGSFWNELAWFGCLFGRPQEVMFAAEKAVSIQPDASWLDTRGVTRALVGNLTGAIEDFSAFVNGKSPDEKEKAMRREWIVSLKEGRNPFTSELLEQLKAETMESLKLQNEKEAQESLLPK
jgi:WD40 repeat protein/tetratricopeptide (TPR) repeat protein